MHNHAMSQSVVRSARRPLALALATAAALGLAAAAGAVIVGSTHLQAADQPVVAAAPVKDEQAQAVRVGLYDSRAVAVAYVRSAMSAEKLRDLMKQRSEAEASGNAKRVEELDTIGESLQIRRHLQGFSNAPVEDIIEVVKDKLPEVAKQHDVVIIASTADYHAANVEVIDVTDSLVQLFAPDAQTLKGITELRKRKPDPIEAIAKMPAVK